MNPIFRALAMKTALILALTGVHAFAAEPILPRVTTKTLAELQAKDPMVRLIAPAAGEVKVARPDNQSIIRDSTILSDGTHWTIVPKRAVVHVPNSLTSRVEATPTGTLLPWLEFLTLNRGWITTTEVTVFQAAGADELPGERTAFWSAQDKLVVAVHQGGPISVRLPKSPSPTLTKR